MSILQWPASERPRERLLQHGAQALSDAELLAIFLRTGVKGKSAVDVARELLTHFGGIRALLEADQKDFCEGAGLGEAKYTQLKAVVEMARRHQAEQLAEKPMLTDADNAKAYINMHLRDLPNEVFSVVFLDAQHQLIHYQQMFNGTISSASVYPREVVKTALKHNAAAVILAHNHPSGVAEPSEADKAITAHLKKALALVDIQTLDHFVVGANETISFAQRGLI